MRLGTLAWRGLRARPLRTALTVLGIALGVAVVAATFITGASSEQALHGATAELLGSADVRLRAFDERGFRPRTVQSVRSLPGVDAAAPVAERRLTVSTAPGADEAVFDLTVYGVDPEADAEVRPDTVVDGRALRADATTDALVAASWASRHGLGVGDQLLLDGRRQGFPALEIVGLLSDRGLAATAGGDVLVMVRSALDAAFEVPAPIRYLDVDLGPAPDDREVA
ncbi:MAG: ABC transporter permease, partial [Chloroflexi bacterium]|nr:ABC transporter permease [Chloroflexota bacterium]